MFVVSISVFSIYFSYLSFFSIEITPPPTPSPVKVAGKKRAITPPPTPSPVKAAGKKRAMASNESDENNSDVFVPR
jgi:hypothetical protein